MLIEQIIEVKLGGLSPLVVLVLLSGYFHDNTKISQDKSSCELAFTSKIIAGDVVPCFPPSGFRHLQNLTLKCEILSVFWT